MYLLFSADLYVCYCWDISLICLLLHNTVLICRWFIVSILTIQDSHNMNLFVVPEKFRGVPYVATYKGSTKINEVIERNTFRHKNWKDFIHVYLKVNVTCIDITAVFWIISIVAFSVKSWSVPGKKFYTSKSSILIFLRCNLKKTLMSTIIPSGLFRFKVEDV